MTGPTRALIAVAATAAALAACSSSGDGPSASPPQPATGTGSPSPVAGADWPTYHADPARTGVARAMPPSTDRLRIVASLDLGANVYASPVIAGGVTVVATERNAVVGLDRRNAQLWRTVLGSPARDSELPCGNIDPLGITGTPVVDVGRGVVYVAPEYGDPVRHELVALDLKTGKPLWRKDIDLPGVDATAMQQRGALTITKGRTWVPFGGLAGDCGAYKGRVVGVRLDGTGPPVAFTVPTTREAGIWTPPGPSVDARGGMFVAVGNGESGPGDPYDFSDSVLRLDGTRLADSFSPTTWATDNAADLDLGSQGPALVGQRWVLIAGKSGTAYVLRRDDLGGIGGEVSSAEVCHSFGGTAVDGDVAYLPCTDGVRAVRVRDDGTLDVLWRAPETVTGSPVVGGGRVWALDTDAGVLHALDLATGRSRAQVEVGPVNRFATPAVRGGELLVPTLSGLSVVEAGG